MAKIIVRGKTQNRKEIKRASQFFCNRLTGHLSNYIFLKIIIVDDLYEKHKEYGYISFLDKPIKTRIFNIKIAGDVSYKMLFCTLAHELVHVKQFARSELKCHKYPDMVYKNRLYKKDYNYWDLPFEKEAHQAEKYLYEEWLIFKNNNFKGM